MTIHVKESYESRAIMDSNESNQKSLELDFFCYDDATTPADLSPVAVEDALLATLRLPPYSGAILITPPYPDPIYGLRLQSINLQPLAKNVFTAIARYGIFDGPKAEKIEIGFATSGGAEQVTHSLSTLARYAATGQLATNFNNAVNVTRDGVQGYQRGVPQLSMFVTGYFNPSAWGPSDWLNLLDMCFTYNLSPWHGWPAKHVLFEYAECPGVQIDPTTNRPVAGALVPVKFYFKAGRPQLVTPAPGINFVKDPFDYVWHYYVPTTDAASVALSHKIQSTQREQIFVGADHALLGLGT